MWTSENALPPPAGSMASSSSLTIFSPQVGTIRVGCHSSGYLRADGGYFFSTATKRKLNSMNGHDFDSLVDTAPVQPVDAAIRKYK